MTTDPGERRDLADERESEEYQAMCDTVRAELKAAAKDWGNDDWEPEGPLVHHMAMRRLKAKYAQ